jgi:PAS domain S-box-containing protein
MDKVKTIIRSSPFVISMIYIIGGSFWILYSDQAVFAMIDDPATLTKIQSIKGWFFVLVSGVVIFFLVQKNNSLLDESLKRLKKSKDKYEATFDQAPVGIVHHQLNEKWIDVNDTICRMLGYGKDELLKLNFNQIIHPEDIDNGREFDQALLDKKVDRYEIEKRYRRKNGSYIYGLLSKSIVTNGKNDPLYMVGIIEDITDRKKSENIIKKTLKDKELLLSEIHHRVKNNLALISALFELQNMFIEDRKVRNILDESKLRIKCLAMIHDRFSESGRTADINFSRFLEEYIDFLSWTFKTEKYGVQVVKDIKTVHLNINQAIPISLICNEILINANPFDEEKPEISISLSKKIDLVTLKVYDNGKGLFRNHPVENEDSLTFLIVNSLIAQINGKLETRTTSNGTSFEVTFKKVKMKGPGSSILEENDTESFSTV